jgi:ATPase subunit of ABC transporter with duplicated ATPase domains
MKKCSRCKEIKDDNEFNTYRKYGKSYLKAMCKPCSSSYYEEKGYFQKYYQNNKDDLKAKQKEYLKTEKGRKAVAKAQQNYRQKEEYSLKQNARKKVLRAVKSGKIIKPSLCEICKRERFLEAHHIDYSKPLEVQWLCKECHENTHHLNEGHESM